MQAVEAIPRAHAQLRRLDLRVVTGLLLMLIAVIGGSSLIRKAQARTPALVAKAEVQPGEVIKAEDVRIDEVSLPAGIGYIPASARTEVVGQVAAEPLWPGKLLGPGAVSQAPPLRKGMVAFSLLLPLESAVAGEIRAGDRTAVLASPRPEQAVGADELGTTILFDDVRVLSVRQASAAEGDGVLVVLALRLEEARAIAEARATGRVDLALIAGKSR